MFKMFDRLFNRTKIVELKSEITELEARIEYDTKIKEDFKSVIEEQRRDLMELINEKQTQPSRFMNMIVDIEELNNIDCNGRPERSIDVVLQLPSFGVRYGFPPMTMSDRPDFTADNVAARLDSQMKHDIVKYIGDSLELQIRYKIMEILK